MTTTLEPGQTSNDVAHLQARLVQVGIDAPTHGSYDEETVHAVARFQEMAGLGPNGYADADTLHELDRWVAHASSYGDAGVVAPGSAAVVDPQGRVVATGVARSVSRTGSLEPLDWTQARIAEVAACLAGGAFVCSAMSLAQSIGWTVAVGYDSDVAGVLGISSGLGIYFGPNGETGIYSSIGADLGAVVGASAVGCFTAVPGGPENLAGDCVAIEASAGELAVAGAAILFAPSGGFVGVAASVGVGIGFPVNVFVSYSSTHLVPR